MRIVELVLFLSKVVALSKLSSGAGSRTGRPYFCRRPSICLAVPAWVRPVSYTHLVSYAMEEVCDAVAYFAAHAEEYDIAAEKMSVGGHSAGGQIAAGAALMLRDRGTRLACQMLVYPATCLLYTSRCV